jgi:uncharacterized iron-regulated membrane protein
MTVWQRWLHYPERSRVRNAFFQIHYWMGMIVGLYVLLMSVSGSVIVFRSELGSEFSVEWLVSLHTDLRLGSTGRLLNGFGAMCLTLLCLTGIVIWWPGIMHWRRSLTISWRSVFARIIWDLHSAFGFWCFFFVALWGISGIYFAFPQLFDGLYHLDSADRFTTQGLFWLAQLHFGRFNWFTEALWSVLGLVPAVLALSGIFICCRRVIYKKPSNPKTETPTAVVQQHSV